MTMTPVLSAHHLSKTIGGRPIVSDVSFDVASGEIFGFLGPNGAGKTTTIRMLVGLIRPTSGSVTICGYDLDQQFENAARCFGCIVENPDLYRFMTGRENLEHFARMLGLKGSASIEAVADLVSLGHRLDDRVRTYSLGMRQRLGIAQAMLGSPRLLILDEPANGLDPAGIHEMRELLRMLARERGLSIFISSHLLGEVELLCDRIAIIHRGKILASGNVSELIAPRQELSLDVSNSTRATEVLSALGFRVEKGEEELLLVHAETIRASEIVDALVRENIGVKMIAPRVQTLEQMFLEATGGESVV